MAVRRRWILVPVVVLVLVAAAAGTAAWRWYAKLGPHLRDDLAALDRMVADTLTAAGDAAAVAVDGLVRVRTCPLRPLRTGGRYTRGAEFYLDPGAESALVTALAGRLPAADHPRLEPSTVGGAPSLTATGPHGVLLTVHQLGDGWVVATAATRCTDGPARTADPLADAADPATVALDGVLTALAGRPASVHRIDLSCGTGRAVTTAALSQPMDPSDLAHRVPVPAGAHVFRAGPANRVAYRTGATSVIVAATDDGTAVTAEDTTTC